MYTTPQVVGYGMNRVTIPLRSSFRPVIKPSCGAAPTVRSVTSAVSEVLTRYQTSATCIILSRSTITLRYPGQMPQLTELSPCTSLCVSMVVLQTIRRR